MSNPGKTIGAAIENPAPEGKPIEIRCGSDGIFWAEVNGEILSDQTRALLVTKIETALVQYSPLVWQPAIVVELKVEQKRGVAPCFTDVQPHLMMWARKKESVVVVNYGDTFGAGAYNYDSLEDPFHLTAAERAKLERYNRTLSWRDELPPFQLPCSNHSTGTGTRIVTNYYAYTPELWRRVLNGKIAFDGAIHDLASAWVNLPDSKTLDKFCTQLYVRSKRPKQFRKK